MQRQMGWSRRGALAAGAGAAASALFGATAARAQQATPLRVSMGLLRAPISALVALAEQKGWFREAGLVPEITLFPASAGPKILQAMGGGSLPMAAANATPTLLALAEGAVPLKMISIPTDSSPVFALLSAPEIDTMAKLAGKRVATTAGIGLQYFLGRALQKHGMSLRDVQFQNLPAPEAQAAFLAGRVDAIVPSVNGRYYILNTKPDTRQLFTYEDFSRGPGPAVAFHTYDVFIATEELIRTNGEALRRFLAAYHGKAVPFLRNPATQEEAITSITQYVINEQRSPTDEQIMRQLLLAGEWPDQERARAIIRSDDFRAGMEDQVKFFRDLGLLRATPRLDNLIVGDLV